MVLIVDSGSTKTTWLLQLENKAIVRVETLGINPVRDSEATIQKTMADARTLLGENEEHPDLHDCSGMSVFFYGAGCIEPYSLVVQNALQASFPYAQVAVESDLLGAARALCGSTEGIACILGTGANSCFYDGTAIVAQTPALGWILGDEGSGAVLGRRLVGDVLKRQLPDSICEMFMKRFNLTQTDIIERVYRTPQPNRFLASLVPFLAEYSSEPSIHAFLIDEFRRFLRRNVLAYHRVDLPVSFVGGVASQFSGELTEAVQSEGLIMGTVLRDPVYDILKYHEE